MKNESLPLRQVVPEHGAECVWMRAGLIRYKLCDRNFDCEHCPLDAALHGGHPDEPGTVSALSRAVRRRRQPPAGFLGDRLYTTSHTWLKPLIGSPNGLRFGIDCFAASILPEPHGVSWCVAPRIMPAGTQIFRVEFEFGVLSISLPIEGTLIRRNESLEEHPFALIDEPYDQGWIAEIETGASEFPREHLDSDAAEKQARLDARQLRRRIALQLLLPHETPCERGSNDGVVSTDVREILGVRQYLHMLQSFIH